MIGKNDENNGTGEIDLVSPSPDGQVLSYSKKNLLMDLSKIFSWHSAWQIGMETKVDHKDVADIFNKLVVDR